MKHTIVINFPKAIRYKLIMAYAITSVLIKIALEYLCSITRISLAVNLNIWNSPEEMAIKNLKMVEALKNFKFWFRVEMLRYQLNNTMDCFKDLQANHNPCFKEEILIQVFKIQKIAITTHYYECKYLAPGMHHPEPSEELDLDSPPFRALEDVYEESCKRKYWYLDPKIRALAVIKKNWVKSKDNPNTIVGRLYMRRDFNELSKDFSLLKTA